MKRRKPFICERNRGNEQGGREKTSARIGGDVLGA